jgi:methylation protein EvaC|tara:strand:+ start:626 stop:1798 length:1173 start_codon:yes stop_codon:yes gene_type:complete
MIVDILDLGMQPIANAFIDSKDVDKESFYRLIATYDTDMYSFSQKNILNPDDMFNSNYAYFSSNSKPMVEHFRKTAELLQKQNPKSVLEIGSNDGCFIKNFPIDTSVCIEPSSNLANLTDILGYKTYDEFFALHIVDKLLKTHGKFDLIYSANCICHIPSIDGVLESVSQLLSDDGMFVFEDPSLLSMIQKNSYDQIYDEHPYIFSILFINKITSKYNLEIKKIDTLSVHGGSNRIYVGLKNGKNIDKSVQYNIDLEKENGLDKLETFVNFSNNVYQSKLDLLLLLESIFEEGKKVLSYGATSKSTTIFNYCGIDSDLIECVSDTSDTKIGKLTPGSHIPIYNRSDINLNEYDYIFLGAWNFKDYIINNEKEWIENGGKLITHVPTVHII